MVEIHPWCWLVCRVRDTKVNPYLEAVNLLSIHLLFCLFSHCNGFKVEKGEATRALAGSVQHDVHLLDVAKLAECSLEFGICRLKVEAEHSDAVGGFWVLTVTLGLGRPALGPSATVQWAS